MPHDYPVMTPAQDPGLVAQMLRRVKSIGPFNPEISEAGMPSPGSGLWRILNVASRRLPEFQKLTKYIPLEPAGGFGQLGKELVKRIVRGSPKGPETGAIDTDILVKLGLAGGAAAYGAPKLTSWIKRMGDKVDAARSKYDPYKRAADILNKE